jgi:uncharacterized protein (TIGR00255 family)
VSTSLASMTGFARAERQSGSLRLRVEIKSVNGRGLDMRLRLAPGLDAVDVPLRQLMSKSLSRGSINLVASIDNRASAGAVRVNEAALSSILTLLDELNARVESAPPRLDAILALPGVLEVEDGAGAFDEDVLTELLLACAAEAIDNLRAARLAEGLQIANVLLSHLDIIAALVEQAQIH